MKARLPAEYREKPKKQQEQQEQVTEITDGEVEFTPDKKKVVIVLCANIAIISLLAGLTALHKISLLLALMAWFIFNTLVSSTTFLLRAKPEIAKKFNVNIDNSPELFKSNKMLLLINIVAVVITLIIYLVTLK